MPVLWIKSSCSNGTSQIGNWYFYFHQLIACKFITTQFVNHRIYKLKPSPKQDKEGNVDDILYGNFSVHYLPLNLNPPSLI